MGTANPLRMIMPGINRRVALGLVAVIAFLTPGALHAASRDDVPRSEYETKANYLVRFLGYVTWPATAFPAPDAPFVIGVLGRNPFGSSLEELARAHPVQGRQVLVRQSRAPSELLSCHLVFVVESEVHRYDEIRRTFAGRPVLLVADGPPGLREGFTLEFRPAGDTVRFAIHLPNAEANGLSLSARLMQAAVEIVRSPKPAPLPSPPPR